MRFSIDYFSSNKKMAYLLFFGVLIIAAFFYLGQLNKFPFADYDEATYAQVTRDTLASGDILTLKRFSQNWFEKPPLYFWLAMASTEIFGVKESSYRLPSAFMAILGIAALWLLVKKLTKDSLAATASAIFLLTFSFYFISARQVRLDIPAITMIMISLTALIYGWEKRKVLLLVSPAIAIGFLFKSVLVLFVIPALLIFSLFYKKFRWLSDIYFWLGSILALIIAIPWHWMQYNMWGKEFFNQYLGLHVFERFNVGLNVRPSDPFDFIKLLNNFGQPWITLALFFFILALWRYFKKLSDNENNLLLASGASALVIMVIVLFSKTMIITYFLPIFPFMAIMTGVGFVWLMKKIKNIFWRLTIVVLFVAVLIYSIQLASGSNAKIIDRSHKSIDYDEKNIGLIVSQDKSANFYLLGWPLHESLRYYSGKEVIFISIPPTEDVKLVAPWYMLITEEEIPFFFEADGSTRDGFVDTEKLYYDNGFLLLYGQQDIILGI